MAKIGGVARCLSAVVVSGALVGPVAAQPAPAQPAAAQPAPMTQRQGQISSGQMWYKKYCASCHGMDGKGGGPTAVAMKETLPDLTLLAKKNNGHFPYTQVLDLIDGTTTTPGHGSKEMPVWGETFQSDTGVDTLTEAAVRGKLMLLTDYLRSIQQK